MKRRINKYLMIVIISLLFKISICMAQGVWTYYTDELPGVVFDMTQDKYGNYWFATDNAVCQLDTSQTQPDFIDIQFLNSKHGLLISRYGDIFIYESDKIQWRNIHKCNSFLYSIHFMNEDLGFACGSDPNSSVIYKTIDSGFSWNLFGNLDYYCSTNSFYDLSSTGSNLWLIYNGYCIVEPYFLHGFVFQANLNADSLTEVEEVFHQEGGITAIETYPPTKKWLVGAIYYRYSSSGHYGIIYYNDSIDGNSEWIIQYVDSLEDRTLNSIVFTDSLHGWACGNKGIILNTENGGSIWKEQPSKTNADLLDIHFSNDELGWVVGRQGTILKTINGGETWNEQISNTTEDLWCVTSILTDTVWAGGTHMALIQSFDGGNVWIPSIITKINNEIAPLNPEKLILEQNYPNPFNSETEIRFQLPVPEQTTLMVYNLLGQKIRTLVRELKQAGNYSVRWDGRDENGLYVASGVYVYILQSSEFVDVKKMVLLR